MKREIEPREVNNVIGDIKFCHAVRGKLRENNKVQWHVRYDWCSFDYIIKREYKRKKYSDTYWSFSIKKYSENQERSNFKEKSFLDDEENYLFFNNDNFLLFCFSFVYKHTSLKSFNIQMQLFNSLQKRRPHTTFFSEIFI